MAPGSRHKTETPGYLLLCCMHKEFISVVDAQLGNLPHAPFTDGFPCFPGAVDTLVDPRTPSFEDDTDSQSSLGGIRPLGHRFPLLVLPGPGFLNLGSLCDAPTFRCLSTDTTFRSGSGSTLRRRGGLRLGEEER